MFGRRIFFSPGVPLFLCWVVLLCAGCQGIVNLWPPEATLRSDKVLEEQYRIALDAYYASDYDHAAIIFAAIGEQTTDRLLARKALFGLACARLMMADTQETMAEAMADWNTWVQAAPQQWEKENPLLFVPIVNEKLLLFAVSTTEPQQES